MATYTTSLQAVHRPSAPAPYLVSNTIDIAVENAAHTAIAANDILKGIYYTCKHSSHGSRL